MTSKTEDKPVNSSMSLHKRKSTLVDDTIALSKWKKRKQSISKFKKSLLLRKEYILPHPHISRQSLKLSVSRRKSILLAALFSEDGKIDEDYFDEMVFIERPIYTQLEFDEGFENNEQPPMGLYAWLKSQVQTFKFTRACFSKTVASYLPFIAIMKEYSLSDDLINDIVAGITIGILHIPQGMAFGQLTTLPPVYGLYCSFFPVFLYFFFGTSKHISLGTFAVVSLMVGTIVQKGLTGRHLEFSTWNATIVSGTNITVMQLNNGFEVLDIKLKLAMSATFMVGIIQLLLGIFQLGFITVYMSDPLISGFTTAAAFHVLTSQISHIFGIEMEQYSGSFRLIYSYRDIINNLPNTSTITIIASILCIFLLVLVKECINSNPKIKLKVPVPIDLIVVILSTVMYYSLESYEGLRMEIVGDIPLGIPGPNLDAFYFVPEVALDCFAIAIVGFAVSVSMAKIFARKHNYVVDSNQELLAYGICNIVSAFFNTFASGVSLSRSLVQENIGGRTQVTGLVSSVVVVFVLLVVGPYFRTLPNCVLASIILVALKGMFMQFLDLKALWHVSFIDFAIWVVTFSATLLLDVDLGLLIGIGFSLFTVIFRSQRPYYCLLGQVSDTDIYSDINLYRTAEEIPNIKIFRFDSALYFANVEFFKKSLYKMTVDPNDLKKAKKKQDEKNKKAEEEFKASKEYMSNTSIISVQENILVRDRCSIDTGGTSADPSDFDSHAGLYRHTTGLAALTNIQFIILDCSTMSFLDSMGVNVLLQIMMEYRAHNVAVYLAQCKSSVREMFERSKFYHTNSKQYLFITIHDAVISAQLHQCSLMSKQVKSKQISNGMQSKDVNMDVVNSMISD